MSLSFEQIKTASPATDGPKTLKVPVPMWGGEVTLRKMNADEFITYTSRFQKETEMGSAVLYLVTVTAVDDDGKQLFDTQEKMDLLNSPENSEALVILGEQALAFNRREGTPKNFPATPSKNSE